MAKDKGAETSEGTEVEAAGPVPVKLPTRRDFSLVETSLRHRLESLEKLAKKNDDEGYPSLGRKVNADAIQIRDFILPAFLEQIEIPLLDQSDLASAVAGLIRPTFDGVSKKADPEARDNEIIEQLCPIIALAISSSAERGYWYGEAARDATPAIIGVRAVAAAQADSAGK